MANLKQIRKHIASVQNTGKITKAMKRFTNTQFPSIFLTLLIAYEVTNFS